MINWKYSSVSKAKQRKPIKYFLKFKNKNVFQFQCETFLKASVF